MPASENGNGPAFDVPNVEVVEVIRRVAEDGSLEVRVETNVDEDKTRSILAIALMTNTFDYMEPKFEDMLEIITGDEEDD